MASLPLQGISPRGTVLFHSLIGGSGKFLWPTDDLDFSFKSPRQATRNDVETENRRQFEALNGFFFIIGFSFFRYPQHNAVICNEEGQCITIWFIAIKFSSS